MSQILLFLNLLLFIFLVQVNGIRNDIFPNVSAGDPDSQSIIFIGDTQKTSTLEFWREKNDSVAGIMLQKISSENPLCVVHLGDMVSDGNSEILWRRFYSDAKELFDKKIPIYPALGNHDYFGSDGTAFSNLTAYFPFFKEKTWYSVKISHLHKTIAIILLNSNFTELTKKQNSEQVEWFNSELEKFQKDTTVKYIVVAVHKPPYTNSKVVDGNKKIQSDFVNQFMLTPKAKFFFSGHCHSYEHFMKGDKHFIVSGGGGGPRQELKIPPSDNIYEDLYKGPSIRNFNYCKLSFIENGIKFEMIMLDNERKFKTGESFISNY